MVKIEFASNSMRFSTKFVHSLQKSNYGSSQVSKDIYSVENAVNDATRLFAKIEIDRNQDEERVSSFLIQLPKQKMNLDVKVPKHGILSRKTNANGWIKLKYRFNKEVYFALFKIVSLSFILINIIYCLSPAMAIYTSNAFMKIDCKLVTERSVMLANDFISLILIDKSICKWCFICCFSRVKYVYASVKI